MKDKFKNDPEYVHDHLEVLYSQPTQEERYLTYLDKINKVGAVALIKRDADDLLDILGITETLGLTDEQKQVLRARVEESIP